jgi:hypothetical protein
MNPLGNEAEAWNADVVDGAQWHRNDMNTYDKNVSPVGWYVGSYLLRFIELDAASNDDPDGKFLAWENTVIVQAGSLEEAWRKVEAVGEQETVPYRSGDEGIPAQWVFEGITELLPIYEPLKDGAEIMWEKHDAFTLAQLKRRTRTLEQLKRR